MKTQDRQAVWMLLSALFVDTEHVGDLPAVGRSLRSRGLSVKDVETILRREMAPVCGRWMLYPGAVGPWPMFDEQALKQQIEEFLRRPWYKRFVFMMPPRIECEWQIVRHAMLNQPD